MSLHYNYGAIEAAASDTRATTAAEQVELDGVKAQMAKAAAIWGGTGSGAYQGAQNSLNSQYAAYVAAANDFANKLSQAGASMGATDGSVGGYWA